MRFQNTDTAALRHLGDQACAALGQLGYHGPQRLVRFLGDLC